MKISIWQHLAKQPSFLVQWQILAAGLLVLGAFLAYNLYLDYVHVDTVEREVLSAQARVVDENLARQLDSISRTLAGIRHELPRWEKLKDGKEQATHRLKALSDAMAGVRTMLVLDARGSVTISNREQLVGYDFSQREYFQAALRDPDPETLYVSSPFTTVLGVFAINVSRAIIGPDGRFAGIVCATLDPEEFEVLLNSVLYAPDMWSALVHGDGRLFMRMPRREGIAGVDLAKPGTFFTRHRDSGRLANTMTGVAYITGDERMVSLRTIQPPALRMNKPMVVSVTRNLRSIFAACRRDAYFQGGLYASLVLVCVLGLFFYQRRQVEYNLLDARREAEQRKAAERLKLATETAGVGVWEYDLASGELIWDDSMFAIYGMDPTLFTHVYEAWRNSVLPEDIEEADAAGRTAAEQGLPFGNCFRIRRGDGQIRSIRATGRVCRDESGRAVRMVGTNEDITERKQAEEKLDAFNRDFEAFLDQTTDFIYFKDIQSRFRFCSQTLATITGHTHWREMIGKHDREVFPPDTAKIYEEEEAQVLAEGLPLLNRVDPYYDSAGRLGYVQTNKWPLFDAAGKVAGIFGISRDITERKQAEDALRASQASLQALLDNTPYLMWLKDADCRYVAVNKAFVLTSGKASAAEIIGKTDFDLLPKEMAERYRADDVEVMASLGQKLIEEQYIHFGQRCWVEVFKMPILNQDGQLLGTVGFAQDISERRERERQRLADAVAYRDNLVREVHHRIKNNLQSVAGLLRLELGKYLEMNPRLETAICQVYAIAAVHGLQSTGPEEAILLSDTVREICRGVQEQFQRPVVFRIEDDRPGFAPVRLDKEEAVAVALVLNELILNAAKHTPQGGVDPVVELWADGRRARVSIHNSLAGEADFDFASGSGVNTGLRLVRSLLPKQGAELSYEKDGEKLMVTRLVLTAPVVEAVAQQAEGA